MRKAILYILIAGIMLIVVLPNSKEGVIINEDPFNLEEIIDKIKSDNDWYSSIKDKVKKNNRKVENQVFLDAVYTLRKENQKYNDNLTETIEIFKKNDKKYKKIKEQAELQGNSLNFQLYFEAHSEVEKNYSE